MKRILIGVCLLALATGCGSAEEEESSQDAAATAALADAPSVSDAEAAALGEAAADAAASASAADGAATIAAGYGEETDAALFGTGDTDEEEDPYAQWQRAEEERRRGALSEARSRVLSAQDDLDRSVRRLGYNDWENDLPGVKRRLRELEDANQQLGSVDPGAASSMDFEIARMKRETRRLEDENWRDVVPDLERRNRAIGFEADTMQSADE